MGQIKGKSGDEPREYEVSFLRREKPKGYIFIFPAIADVSDVPFEDIVHKLPKPIQHGGTARVARHLIFPVNLSSYDAVLR